MLRIGDRLEPSQSLRNDTATGPCPAGQRFFRILKPQNTEILEKSRAARAKDGQIDHQNRESADGNRKSEDPAKMTYSTTDFLSRTRIKKRHRIS